MSQTLIFKYNKKFNEEVNRHYYTPTADVILINDEETFETAAMIDSGSD